ncbi:MAG: hypothetical protein RR841_08040, partial [Eubacterium sp.]
IVRYEGAECYGFIDFDSSLIQISNECSGEQNKVLTLLHEILHGLIYHYNVEVDDEEKLVCGLSKGLYQVLSDNEKALFGGKDET